MRQLVSLIAVLAVAVFSMVGSIHAQEPTIRLTQADGTVQIRKSGETELVAAKEGDVIERGDRLATRAKSAALLLWSNGSMIKMYPNTELVSSGVFFDFDTKMEKTLIDLENGRLFVKAQVPDNLFADFKLRMGGIFARAQGAEYAIKFDSSAKSVAAWPVLGRLVIDAGPNRLRIDEGQQATVQVGTFPGPDAVAPMDDKMKQALNRVSDGLGGSLLKEEWAGTPGGKLAAKVGGVRARRGNTPYTVRFKALVAGGSGQVKSISWDFGDGEEAEGTEVEHTFTQGVYAVVLRAEDANGEKASAQISISVEADCGC